ncbi:hypothetical protein OLMES_1214 [Oleiphilus messinensis]|uniref:TonB C-terminal domain-containing protein n=1 Tax=Oleiphilus messinensis TaxID=141451 RepID=A0A1Y0I682_9GAMM|nr:energy transducer TonB [Oleiphilus messinensis]ARU55296.1 hypothetical protein OLMES_1214 [Oleiphilus messinensis]
MHDFDTNRTYRIAFSMAIALVVHATAVALFRNPIQVHDKYTADPIQITLATNASKQTQLTQLNPAPTKPDQPPQVQPTPQANTPAQLTTSANTTRKVTDNRTQDVAGTVNRNTNPDKPPTQNLKDHVRITQPTFHTPEANTSRQLENQTRTDQLNQLDKLSTLFESKSPAAAETSIQSAKMHPLLPAYELELRVHLAKSQYHDKLYPFSRLQQPRSVIMSIQLLSNGALKNASIAIPSGDPDLDQAALRSALSASPYPRPPKTDAKKGFRYEIDVKYVPRN